MSTNPANDATQKAAELFQAFKDRSGGHTYAFFQLEDLPATQQVLSAEPEVQAEFVRITIDRVAAIAEAIVRSGKQQHRLSELTSQMDYPISAAIVVDKLLRRRLPFTSDHIEHLLNRTDETVRPSTRNLPFLGALVGCVEKHVARQGLTTSLKEAIERVVQALGWINTPPERKLATRLSALAGLSDEVPIEPGEVWGDATTADIKSMASAERSTWMAFLALCAAASGSQPSAKWLKEASEFTNNIGQSPFRQKMLAWLPLVEKPCSQQLVSDWRWIGNWEWRVSEPNADILKGLVWCCALEEDPAIARALTALALTSYKKLPGIGPRLVKVGNACVWALGRMPGMEGVGQLAVLRVRVKFGTAQLCIEKALTATAERVGLSREELDEMAVPSYGLTEVGLRRETLGEFTTELAVDGSSTELRWFRADGKRQASVPAAIQKDFADDLKELKQAAKDIQRMLPAQAERLDQLHLRQKSWPLALWRERYLDHPLVGTLARRLIWTFTQKKQQTAGVFFDGAFVDPHDRRLKGLDDATQVTLWHPIGHSPDEILAWRQWFESRHVQQPFKQAHREIYLLTDAERQTRTYSNRYAAHILRQHQFAALCAARGWKNKLRLLVDDEFPPATLLLPQWNLRAEFWVEGAGNDYGVDTNDTGTFYYLSTDQVRFYTLESAQVRAHAAGGGYGPGWRDQPAEPIPLEQVPPLVLSEVLRDVDLFVGVASVGNDPSWADGGPRGDYRDYWREYAFGQLTESSQTRKQVLERLLPRLKIAARCTLTDRFLVVRGDLRTYKIHLGSGNILMEPDDQYLCIVKAQSREGEQVFLPFEGDGTLAVILSKAYLLAEDTKITDPTITRQIGRRT